MEVDFGKNDKLLLICWYIYIYVCYVIVMINVIVRFGGNFLRFIIVESIIIYYGEINEYWL